MGDDLMTPAQYAQILVEWHAALVFLGIIATSSVLTMIVALLKAGVFR
jgi:hypothetical protein